LDLDRLAKLTGLPIPKEDVDIREPERVDPNAAPVKTSLRVKLLGTLAATLGDQSIAAILDTSNMKAQTFRVGDQIQGAQITEIQRDRVLILHDRRREYIGNDANEALASAAVDPRRFGAPVNEPPSVAVGTGIRAVSDTEYEVPRAEIDKTMSNLNDVAMQARIVPAFKDGQAQGFKLFSIRPDSLYTKIGIQNGDVIRRINGYDLNSPEKALEIYTKLKDTSRIDIELERNGQPVRKTYNVR
jgi:general secretion pathway protein C